MTGHRPHRLDGRLRQFLLRAGQRCAGRLWSEMAATWRDDGGSGPGRDRHPLWHPPAERFDLFLPDGRPGASSSSSMAATGSGWTNPPSPTSPRARVAMAGPWRCPATRRPPRSVSRSSPSVGAAIAAAAGGSPARSAWPGIRRAGIWSRAWPARAPPARPRRGTDRTGAVDQRHPRPAPPAPVGDERRPEAR
jgi:hypothetical protein